jgi:hypothetical protein
MENDFFALLNSKSRKQSSAAPKVGAALNGDQRRLSISCNFYCEALGFGVLAPKAKGVAIKIAGNRRFGTNQPTVVPPLVTF